MSSIVGALTGGGDSGVNFRAKQADLIQAATKEQADQQYGNVQSGLGSQQSFLQALQAQNGVQNQSNVFNQLQGVANGTGPNPAQAQLAQATGANTANQAALMAGQRGASANTGLIARQAAMQGGANQQNAAGQAATLQANQSLNAINSMGNVANQQVTNQGQAANSYTNAALQGQSNVLNAINGLNSNNVQMQSNANTVNGQLAQQIAGAQMNAAGKVAGSIGSAGNLFSSLGGSGGAMGGSQVGGSMAGEAGAMGGLEEAAPLMMMAAEGGQVPSIEPKSKVAQYFAQGGKVPAMVSPGEKYLDPQAVQQVKSGANPMQVGEKVPGKAVVGGDKNSYTNDTVPKTLDEGGIVLPRSVTQSKNPGKSAADFVAAIMKKESLKKGK